jgi:hypothetical protein
MIDFKNVKRRIKKHTVEEGDFYLKDISSAEGKAIAEKAGDEVDNQMACFLQALMCDESGKLLKLSTDELAGIPVGLLQDIMKAVMAIMYGEKKS